MPKSLIGKTYIRKKLTGRPEDLCQVVKRVPNSPHYAVWDPKLYYKFVKRTGQCKSTYQNSTLYEVVWRNCGFGNLTYYHLRRDYKPI